MPGFVYERNQHTKGGGGGVDETEVWRTATSHPSGGGRATQKHVGFHIDVFAPPGACQPPCLPSRYVLLCTCRGHTRFVHFFGSYEPEPSPASAHLIPSEKWSSALKIWPSSSLSAPLHCRNTRGGAGAEVDEDAKRVDQLDSADRTGLLG